MRTLLAIITLLGLAGCTPVVVEEHRDHPREIIVEPHHREAPREIIIQPRIEIEHHR